MLDLGIPCAVCTRVSGREIVNSYLPFHLFGSSALTIPAGLGILIGLYLFFRGFSLLHPAPGPRTNPQQPSTSAAATTITTTTTYTTKGSDTLTRDSHSEVIRLSSTVEEPARAASMSQQGKIAAALLKAGIPNPASWSSPVSDAPVTVKVKEAQAGEKIASETHVPDRKTAKTLKPTTEAASLRIAALTPPRPASRRPAFMLWGGALLALASIYVLAAHFGWL